MPLSHRRYGQDEELAKRYEDDAKPRVRRLPTPAWLLSPRLRRRRLLTIGTLFTLAFVLYQFAIRIQAFDESRISSSAFRFRDILPAGDAGTAAHLPRAPPHTDGDPESAQHYFDGPLHFYKLPLSLQKFSKQTGHASTKKGVLFAAGSLKSAAALIPLACEMARWRRNDVHFALMGRNDVSLKDIERINGVGGICDISWHDARPDYAPYSSDARLKLSVEEALAGLHSFLRPQVALVDGSDQEDELLLQTVSQTAHVVSLPVIRLPENAVETLMWITRLDSSSLSVWNKVEIEILIQAAERSSGGLIRLLKSLNAADYISDYPPAITMDLPPAIDPSARSFLDEFKWPPQSVDHQNFNRLTLRHRLRHVTSDDDASAQYIESFYPTTPDSHVLVLSPRVELSPLFYHYAKYALLEYKYSAYGMVGRERLAGFSLDPTSSYLNDSGPFVSLPNPELDSRPQAHTEQVSPHLLWQAPNADAALYFGDKWAEFHDFMRRRLEAQQTLKKPSVTRITSRKHPRWVDHLLELFRLRPYYLLYPHLSSATRLLAVHSELAQRPDVVGSDSPALSSSSSSSVDPDDQTSYLSSSQSPEGRLTTSHASLLGMLPAEGDLPELNSMPVLSFDGQQRASLDDTAEASSLVVVFRRDVGGCTDDDANVPNPRDQGLELHRSTADLFCLEDDAEDDAAGRVATDLIADDAVS